jgi:hypothetical protein
MSKKTQLIILLIVVVALLLTGVVAKVFFAIWMFAIKLSIFFVIVMALALLYGFYRLYKYFTK